MQPKKLKGVTYTPMQGTVYSDPYAAWKPLMFQRALQSQLNQQPQQPQQQEKKGGWFFGHDPTAWIRELSGSGGAAGGAALGAGIGSSFFGIGAVPGAIIGGIAGGLGLGSLGSAAEQKWRDGKVDWGKVAKEGAEEAMWGALPGVGKGIGAFRHAPKGARWAALSQYGDDALNALKAGSKAGITIIDDAGKVVGSKGGGRFGRAAGSGRIATAGRHSNLAGSGFKYGQATGGGTYLDPTDANRLWGKFVARGGRAGTPMSQADDAVKFFDDVTKQLSGTLDDVNRNLTKAEKNAMVKAVNEAVANNPAIYGSTAQADKLIQQLGKVKDIKGLELLRQSADDIGWNASKAGKTQAAAQARAFRGVVDDFVTKGANIDESYKALKAEWSDFKAIKELTSKAKSTSGIPVPFAGGYRLPNTGIKNKITRRIATGQLPFADGKIANFMGKPLPKQVGLRTLGAGISGSEPQQPVDDPLGIGLTGEQILAAAQEAGIDQNQIMPMLGGQMNPMQNQMGGFAQAQQDPMAMQMGGFGGQQQQGFNIPREAMIQAMLNDFQATGGQNMDKLIKFFEFANYDALNNTGGGANLSADQKKNMVKMANVQSVIDELNTIVESGMFPEGGQTPLASLGGFYDRNIGKHFDSDKKVYIDQLRSKGILVIRAMGEVGNLSEAEQAAAISTLPAPGDSLDTARQKLEDLRRLFGKVQQNILTYGQTSPGSDMAQQMGGFAQ